MVAATTFLHKVELMVHSPHRMPYYESNYRKVFNIRRTKFQNLSDSRAALQMSLPNLLKPCIKSRMKM